MVPWRIVDAPAATEDTANSATAAAATRADAEPNGRNATPTYIAKRSRCNLFVDLVGPTDPPNGYAVAGIHEDDGYRDRSATEDRGSKQRSRPRSGPLALACPSRPGHPLDERPGCVRLMSVAARAEVGLGYCLEAVEVERVDEHRDLDAVAGRERDHFEQVSAHAVIGAPASAIGGRCYSGRSRSYDATNIGAVLWDWKRLRSPR